MASIEIPKGDKGYNVNFTVKDAGGNAYDLAGYTVTLKVWKPGSPASPVVSGVCAVDDAAAGKCHYTVQEGDFDEVGQYYAELEMTQAGIVESTRTYTLSVVESA